MSEHKYTFEVRVVASIRVKAESEEQARAILREHLQCVGTNAVAVDDEHADLIEVDGEEV